MGEVVQFPAMSNWQPMETAPRDHTVITLLARHWQFTMEVPVFGQWSDGDWYDVPFAANSRSRLIPIGWMPRPEFIGYRDAFRVRAHALG